MSLDDRRLGNLAERLVPLAAEFAGLVHGDGDRDTIAAFLHGLPAEERGALPVILAAMIPPDRTPAELLSWVTWDEYGRPLPPGTELVMSSGRRRHIPDLEPAECGTRRAYNRHLSNGERCEVCSHGEMVRQRECRQDRRRRQQERAA